MFYKGLGSASTVPAMYRCMSVYIYMCVCVYIYRKFLASHHNDKQPEGNFLALRAVYPAPLTVLVLGRTLLWLLLLSTHRHLLWEFCTRQFGTEGMLNILSPSPESYASVVCIVVARMETSGLFLFLSQCISLGGT